MFVEGKDGVFRSSILFQMVWHPESVPQMHGSEITGKLKWAVCVHQPSLTFQEIVYKESQKIIENLNKELQHIIFLLK